MEYLAANKIAIVDLGKAEVIEEELKNSLVQEKIGGAGITTQLYRRFEKEDPIVIGSGLLTGTLVPGAALGIVTAKSPLTGKIGHAPLTLYMGMEFKFSGFDYLVIKGASAKPVYLWLHDGILDIQPAEELWGRDTWTATDSIRQTLGDDLIQVLAIGPAGEAGSSLGQLINNYWGSGDRWGFGGLFGVKKLKGIAVRGMGLLEIADPEPFIEACRDLLTEVKQGPWAGKKGIAEMAADLGEGLTAEWLAPVIHRHKSCFNTPYATNTFLFLDEDPQRLEETEKGEPGFLLTDLYGVIGFQKMGLSALDSGQVLKACAQAGIDPVAVSELSLKSGQKDAEGIVKSLPGLQGTLEGVGPTPFSPGVPLKPIFADFGVPADEGWWVRRQALAYIFGIQPIFALMAPELSEEKLLELAGIGTGMEFSSEKLEQVIGDIC
jgi:Aldehyde ferredoxin oxidoreductase, N-terminal domain